MGSLGRATVVLVVEDDPALRTFYKGALTLAGYVVVTASDGVEALQRIEGHTPAGIVLDLGLPLLSGHDVRQELAAHPETQGPRKQLTTVCLGSERAR